MHRLEGRRNHFGPHPGRYVARVDGYEQKPGSDISERPLFVGVKLEVDVPAGAKVLDLDLPATDGK